MASARLRVLRLVGFKSFAERTVLEFGPGISAVIGPNGSGKSNLADALRWALGEQGRALRARRAEDVIFAGSARRHATGMADVSLVVDNEDGLLPIDFGTLEFGRRLYRSGENEYLLNRQRVRLRDLTDLLDGANLADNAFLFIGQGMVDQALSLRPEERRPLFEEVAGVRRHERRRRQAEVQLGEAEQNLTRLRDILGELRPQARRLAAQAEQAEARERAGQTLAEAVVRSARARGPAAARWLSQAQAEHEAARLAAEEALAELNAAERSAEALAEALEVRAATVRTRRQERDAAQAVLAEMRLTDQRLALELDTVSRDRERLGTERVAVVGRIAAARRAAAQAIPAADPGPELALAALDRALAEASVEAERERTAERREGEREASLRRVHAARAAEREQADRRAADLSLRADAAALARDEAAAAAAAAENRAQAARERAVASRQAENEAEATLNATADADAEAEARRELAAGRLTSVRNRLLDGQARLADLGAALTREEGPDIVTAARRRGGRMVAEGLEVEPRLRLAVEAALGPAIRAAVVGESVVTALRGEHGHLVVEGAKRPDDHERRLADDLIAAVRAAGGGPLGEAIRRDPGGTVRELVGRAAWVPELGPALGLRPLLPPGWILVTPAGERVEAGGLVRLGAADSLLERRAAYDALVTDIEALSGDAAKAEASAASAAEAADRARAARDAARQAAETARRERRLADEAERAAEGMAEAARREAAWAEAQAQRSAQEQARASAEAQALAGLEPPEAAGAPAGGGLAPAARRPQAADPGAAWEVRLADLRGRRAAAAAQVAAGEADRRAAEDGRRRAEVAAELEEARLLDLDRRSADLATSEATLASQHLAAAGEAAQAEGRLREAEVALAEVDGAESASRARLADAERGIPVLRERLRQAEGRVRAAAVATVEARLGLDQVRDGLLVELAGLGRLGLLALGEEAVPAALPVGDEAAFAAELEAAVERAMTAWAGEPAAEDPDAPSPARLSALRRRYLGLGAENPFAAEEYAQVRERLEALEAQRADLEQAIESTHRLIAELSERIVEQFRATFAALEHAFARRFQSLFGGGEAQLVLTEPDDLAATGVEIMARPPGKKRQALAMLSGGERALTAVALLFAMLEVRPVPFCVLDEVDAALDEANVGRFTDALRDLTEATQFIVITHNRGTIEAADALYGVTIGDDAVSRIISLRLAEATALAGAAS